MIRYLHQDADSIAKRLATRMFNHGTYSFMPSDTVPVTED